MKIRINNNHWAGLAYGILGWILGWYSLVLTAADYQDEKTFPLSPTSTQYVGNCFCYNYSYFFLVTKEYFLFKEMKLNKVKKIL